MGSAPSRVVTVKGRRYSNASTATPEASGDSWRPSLASQDEDASDKACSSPEPELEVQTAAGPTVCTASVRTQQKSKAKARAFGVVKRRPSQNLDQAGLHAALMKAAEGLEARGVHVDKKMFQDLIQPTAYNVVKPSRCFRPDADASDLQAPMGMTNRHVLKADSFAQMEMARCGW
jgi:hypothetical protein